MCLRAATHKVAFVIRERKKERREEKTKKKKTEELKGARELRQGKKPADPADPPEVDVEHERNIWSDHIRVKVAILSFFCKGKPVPVPLSSLENDSTTEQASPTRFYAIRRSSHSIYLPHLPLDKGSFSSSRFATCFPADRATRSI